MTTTWMHTSIKGWLQRMRAFAPSTNRRTLILAVTLIVAIASLCVIGLLASQRKSYRLYPETRSLLEWRTVPDIKVYRIEMAGLPLELPVFAMLRIETGSMAKPTTYATGIGFQLLLPDLHPYGPTNAAEHRRLGWGNKMHLSMKPLTYGPAAAYPLHAAENIGSIPLPYVELPPGQLAQKVDRWGNVWHYRYAADRTTPEHVSRCDGDRDSVKHKSCWTFLPMWDRVGVDFRYSADRLHEWPERDGHVRALLDSFLKSDAGQAR